MADAQFSKGDRIVIKPEIADGFLLPLRKYAQSGRPATIIAARDDGYIVEFDWLGKKPKPVTPTTFVLRFKDVIAHVETTGA